KKGFWTLVMDLNELPNRRFHFLKRYTFLKTGCGDSLERECMPVNCYSLARSSSSSAELCLLTSKTVAHRNLVVSNVAQTRLQRMQVKCAEFAQQTGQIPGPVQARGKVSIPGSIRHAQAGERRVSDLQFEMMNFLFQCTDELMPVLHRPQFLRHRRRDPALECGVRKQFEKTGAGGFERDRGMRGRKHEESIGLFS